jgi:hypothetical protein
MDELLERAGLTELEETHEVNMSGSGRSTSATSSRRIWRTLTKTRGGQGLGEPGGMRKRMTVRAARATWCGLSTCGAARDGPTTSGGGGGGTGWDMGGGEWTRCYDRDMLLR